MAKPPQQQGSAPKSDPNDPFAGMSAEQVTTIKSYFDKLLADEKQALETMLSADSAPVTVAAAAGLDTPSPTPDTLMSACAAMYASASEFIAAIEAQARAAAQSGDQGRHTDFSRLATVFGEFRNGLATIVPVSALSAPKS